MLEFPLLIVKVDKWNGTEVVHIFLVYSPTESGFVRNLPRGCARGHFTLFLRKVDSLCFWNIKIPERSVENEIPDSVALYTSTCTIPALLMTQTKHINKRAIISLKYFKNYL